MPPITLLDAMRDPALFASQFPGPAWESWKAFLGSVFGLPLTPAQSAIFQQHTGRSTPPTAASREAWVVAGRRGGKSRIAALVAVYLAAFRDWTPSLAPGERGTIMIIATDRRQARVIMRYLTGLLDSVPMLAALIASRTRESVTLTNRIVLEVHTASFRTIRGYTVIAALLDEVAFWRVEDAAEPDTEILSALRPAMATVPGALLLGISSPYAWRGVLWEAYRSHYGQDGDPILCWQADTQSMNPTVDARVIADAYAQDPAAASAEYGGQFRTDLEAFISPEALTVCVIPGRWELPDAGLAYVAFVDPSGGSQDAMMR